MASQVQGWTEVTSKSKTKKNKEKEVQQLIKQQHADYLHNRNDVEDAEIEDVEYVPESPEIPPKDQQERVQAGDGSELHNNIKALPAYKAWQRRAAEFEMDPIYTKDELDLLKFDILDKEKIVLDGQDITPVPRGWGACLLGRFTGRFPGKEAINNLMKRWPCKSRVTYHSKGWLCFQFGSDSEREKVRQRGPFDIFGIPLVLQPMPDSFNPNMEPEVNVPLWMRLVDLPLALWNLTAISKIASCFGTPISTDYSSLRRESLDGPRVQIIVNTAMRPKTGVTVQLPEGFYEQKVEFEFFPKFCNACKNYGHYTDECRGRSEAYEQHGAWKRAKSKDGTRSRSRPHVQQGAKTFDKEWPKLGENQGAKGVLGARPANRQRSRSRTRQEWVAKGTTYPIKLTYTRTRKEDLGIPSSPNRFESLPVEEGPMPTKDVRDSVVATGVTENAHASGSAAAIDPTVTSDLAIPDTANAAQIERVKELLAAAISPILEGLNGQAPTQKPPTRGRSRDPRTPRARKDNNPTLEVCEPNVPDLVVPSLVEIEGREDNDGNVEEGPGAVDTGLITTRKKKSSKKKHEEVNPNPPEDSYGRAEAEKGPRDNIRPNGDQMEQEMEDLDHLIQPERTGHSSKRKKSKSRSRSRSRGRKDEEIPSDWEDGLEDDPGIEQ